MFVEMLIIYLIFKIDKGINVEELVFKLFKFKKKKQLNTYY